MNTDKMLMELGIGESKFGSSYTTEQNKPVRLLNLPKRECLILVSGYSVEMRARIIDRWLQLEAA
jgi:phage regulator Rha-like protein